jgi:branched-chain amino acid transport system substrate-binding protein
VEVGPLQLLVEIAAIMMPNSPVEANGGRARKHLSRRSFVGGAVGLGLGPLLAACKVKAGNATGSGGQPKAIKIGYVTPQTGPLAAFGEADSFVIDALRPLMQKGVALGSSFVPITVTVKDSQSDPRRASEAASQLILQEEVDLMLVASTPDTVNPVADQCEANGVPCISSVAPWEAFFFARGGKPAKPFTWTYHFFWGLADIIQVYQDMWTDAGAGKTVGVLWPNDADGNAWADPKTGLPPIRNKGYRLVDPGHYQNGSLDYSAQIAQFKQAGADILVGVPIPPDFTNFWKQAAQQGYRPKSATVAKALLFPSAVEALGPLARNLSTEVWWSPEHPFKSSLTGQSCSQLATAYTAKTGKQWTQPIGMIHALFEVAVKALGDAGGPGDRTALAQAIGALKTNSIVGPLDWSSGPVKNVTATPLVGGQWRRGGKYPYDLTIVSNKQHAAIPTAGTVQVLP